MRCPFALVAMLLMVAALSWAQDIDANGLLLFGFETQEEIAAWQTRDLTDLVLTDEWAASGNSAAAVTYHKWEAGKEQWPAIIADAGKALKTTDFTGFEVLQFTACNPDTEPATVKIHIRDTAAKRYSQQFSVGGESVGTFKISVDSIAGLVDAADVATLHFYVTQPSRTYTVFIDDVRLTVDALGPAQRVAANMRELEAETSAVEPVLLASLPKDMRTKLSRIRTVRGQAESVIRRLEAGSVRSWQELRKVRQRVARLEAKAEALNSVLPDLRARRWAQKTGADGFVLAVESSMQKVFLETEKFGSTFASDYRLAAARNEHESFQAVVYPLTDELANVTWELSSLANRQGETIGADVRLVGYVETKQPSYPVDFNGWWPDPLLDFKTSVDSVPGNEVLPLWVTVDVPETAKAGMYRGTLTVAAAGVAPQTVDIACEVWDFAIPKHTHLKTALSWRGHLPQLYPEDQVEAMTRKYHDWMLEEYHLNPNNIYGGPDPSWDVERLKELRAKGLNAINLTYVTAPREPSFNEGAYWKGFEGKVAAIKKALATVEAAGCRDIAFIYCFDERPSSQLDVVFETAARLKELWPDIPVMTTAYDRTFGMERDNGTAMDIWVPLTPHFDDNAENIAKAQELGRDIWWYVCIGPKHPYANWFVEWPAIEGRLLMGAMTAKYEPGGFLYYAVNRWPLNKKVITDGPKTDWNPASYKINNGDGSIMCAGPDGPLATIRIENIRDGIEDYEYYLLLRDLLKAKKRSAALGEVPSAVVEDLSHFTYDPQVLYNERERVAREILRLVQ